MYLAWTTVSTAAEAETLAQTTLAGGFAVCVQIEGPITSHFVWNGKAERTSEMRLCFKFNDAQLIPLENHVLAQHPYDTPEWIVVPVERVGGKYLSWAQANSSTPPL